MTEAQATIIVVLDGQQTSYVAEPALARGMVAVLERPEYSGLMRMGFDWIRLQINMRHDGKQVKVEHSAGN